MGRPRQDALVGAEERWAGAGWIRHASTLVQKCRRSQFDSGRYNGSMPEEVGQTPTFEASLDELERIVKALEKGDLPLEQSLSLFESGMRLSSECKRQLEEAETRVEILMKKGSEVVPVPLSSDKQPK